MEAARELCLYKLRNALIPGPAQWGMRDHSTCFLFEVLSLLCLFQCFGVAPASNSREPAQPASLAGLGCVGVTPARRPNDVGLTIILINADMQFPRHI